MIGRSKMEFPKKMLFSLPNLIGLLSVITVHIFSYFLILPRGLRELIDVSSVWSVIFDFTGGLAISIVLGSVLFPLLVMAFALMDRKRLIGRALKTLSDSKSIPLHLLPLPIQLILMRSVVQYFLFLLIYLGVTRGLIAFGLTVVIAGVAFILSMIPTLFEEALKNREDDKVMSQEDVSRYMASSAPAFILMLILTCSAMTGQLRSFYALEKNDVVFIETFDRTWERVIYVNTSTGLIMYSRGEEMPIIPWVIEVKLDHFTFFPYSFVKEVETGECKQYCR